LKLSLGSLKAALKPPRKENIMNVSARDENGAPVDWWFIFKVPQLSAGAGSDSATGYEYVYYDSTIDAKPDNDPAKRVAKSPHTLDSSSGALSYTLNSIFSNPSATTGYILYNDEMPDSATTGADNGNLGHTKGVLAFDTQSQTAYWLLHSWPKFASPSATHAPTPVYGQTYLCISISLDTARQIAAQMAEHQEPQVYHYATAGLPSDDALVKLTAALNPNAPSDSSVIDLVSAAGMPFKVIAKNRRWNRDFWNELIGPTLGEDMDVETWIRGPVPPIADSDGIHKTYDVKYINLGPLGAHWAWPETHDHAKWGISVHSDWVCIGDINRMVSQRRRGGGAIAFQNPTLWAALSKTNLLLAPPGHSRHEAHALIHATHKPKSHVAAAVTATASPEPIGGNREWLPRAKFPESGRAQ
jgi:deoxyribonuclease-2